MDVILKEVATGEIYEGQILEVIPKELPFKKEGWKFAWRSLARIKGVMLFKLTIKDSPKKLEGLLLLTLVNDELLYMNNIEVAPHNFGSKGQYENVAGSLISFACHKSLELGKGNYVGFLSFDTKTALVSIYQEKYGAKVAIGLKMYIDEIQGEKLIKKYLNTDSDIKIDIEDE